MNQDRDQQEKIIDIGLRALFKRFKDDQGFWIDRGSFYDESLLTICNGLLGPLEIERIYAARGNKDYLKVLVNELELEQLLLGSVDKIIDFLDIEKQGTSHLSSPLVTQEQMKLGQKRPPVSLIAGLSLSVIVHLLSTHAINIPQFKKDKLKELGANISTALIKGQHQYGGWAWRYDPENENKQAPADVYSTYTVCNGLNHWKEILVNDTQRLKNLDKVLSYAVDWMLFSAQKQNNKQGIGWLEYGNMGRHRLFYQILALATIFENGTPQQLADEAWCIWEGLEAIVFQDITTLEYDFELHRFQSDDLRSHILIEERSASYYLLGLWGTLWQVAQKLKKEPTESRYNPALQRINRFKTELNHFLESPVPRAAIINAYQIVNNKKNNQGLWEQDEFRLDSTGFALRGIALVFPIFEGGLQSDDLQNIILRTVQSVIESRPFSVSFAKQVTNAVLSNQPIIQELSRWQETTETEEPIDLNISTMD